MPLGTGLAFANKYRGNDNVTFAYFGDGAANQGQVYESFNMAELWKLPVVYVIENNRYAMGTSVSRASAQTDFSQAGANPSTFPANRSTAWTCVRCARPSARAVEWCRGGNGPIILEMQTYRYRGHSMSDPAKYRTKEEVQKMREERDPIEQVRARLLREKMLVRRRFEKDRRRGARAGRRRRGIRNPRSGARSRGALDRHPELRLPRA